MGKSTPARGFRRGIAIVWTAIILVLMLGFVGLSIDWGKAAIDAHYLQNAADAAALAGAQKLKGAYHDGTMDAPDGPFARARAVALANRAWAGTAVDLYYASAEAYDPSVDVVVGRFFMSTRTFVPFDLTNPEPPNALKAVPRHLKDWHVNAPLPLSFGPVFGRDTANVVRQAVAMQYGGGGAGLVCLDPYRPGISLEGNSKIAVYSTDPSITGEIHVNSGLQGGSNQNKDWAVGPGSGPAELNEQVLEDRDALADSSAWAIYCDQLNVWGAPHPAVVQYDTEGLYTVASGVDPMPDPLAGLPDLDVSAMSDGYAVETDPATGQPRLVDGQYVPVTGLNVDDPIRSDQINTYGTPVGTEKVLTLTPGYYSGGFNMTSASGCVLKLLPGVYAVGGGSKNGDNSGLVVSGGTFEALGVMLYVTQSKQGYNGRVNLNGSESNGAKITITEYGSVSGTVESRYQAYADAGMAIFQDRDDAEKADFQGGSNSSFAGTLYFHNLPGFNTEVELSGNTGNIGIQLICDRVSVAGTQSMVTIMYDGRNSNPFSEVFLVK